MLNKNKIYSDSLGELAMQEIETSMERITYVFLIPVSPERNQVHLRWLSSWRLYGIVCWMIAKLYGRKTEILFDGTLPACLHFWIAWYDIMCLDFYLKFSPCFYCDINLDSSWFTLHWQMTWDQLILLSEASTLLGHYSYTVTIQKTVILRNCVCL